MSLSPKRRFNHPHISIIVSTSSPSSQNSLRRGDFAVQALNLDHAPGSWQATARAERFSDAAGRREEAVVAVVFRRAFLAVWTFCQPVLPSISVAAAAAAGEQHGNRAGTRQRPLQEDSITQARKILINARRRCRASHEFLRRVGPKWTHPSLAII
ncbi:hypothetical protein L596_010413 [Steinernema carpocapsae]|uniref:Uncharacterized protein n=1 Tax=Steinernema carpocapsae TaxID=34508 RepID=A0A4U5PIU0_STECR|nr:hypothetical protein L596_010413 [Steinernema carpocapsae]